MRIQIYSAPLLKCMSGKFKKLKLFLKNYSVVKLPEFISPFQKGYILGKKHTKIVPSEPHENFN